MPIYSFSEIILDSEERNIKLVAELISEKGVNELAFIWLFDNNLSDEEIELILNPPASFGEMIAKKHEIGMDSSRYLNCLFLSNTTVPIELVRNLEIMPDVALYFSFLAGNESLAMAFKTADYDAYLNNINGFIDKALEIESITDSCLVTILTDLLEKDDNLLAREILEKFIKKDSIFNSIVKIAIENDNFVILDKILKYFPAVFDDRQFNDNPNLLALANRPEYLPKLLTVFNKTQGRIQYASGLPMKQFIDAKYETLLPTFQEIREQVRNKPMEKEEVDCCFYMIKALIQMMLWIKSPICFRFLN